MRFSAAANMCFQDITSHLNPKRNFLSLKEPI